MNLLNVQKRPQRSGYILRNLKPRLKIVLQPQRVQKTQRLIVLMALMLLLEP